MADVAPMAQWRPLTRPMSTTALRHDIICLHTMVGTLSGSWNWSNRPGGSYWHFGLGGNGALWQCQDLRYRSAANLNGNWRVIPIETEDHGPSFASWSGRCGDVPAWTNAQINKLVDLIEWLCRRYNIPAVLIPNTAAGRRGIAYHRQGIDPWRCGSCEKWSNSYGKCCPDHRRINQLTSIVIPRVQQRLGGNPPPPPPPPPDGFPGTVPLGDTGTAVKTWQAEFNKAGYKLVVDGDFGPATHHVVVHFQTNHKLTPDGIAGPATWTALTAITRKPPPPPPPTQEDIDMPIQISASGRPARLIIGGALIGWDSETRRARVVTALKAGKVEVPNVVLSTDDYNYISNGLVSSYSRNHAALVGSVEAVRKALTEHDSGHRVVREGWTTGDPVYHSDLRTYIFQVRQNGPWDSFKQSLRRLAGLSPNALRLPADVVDDMIAEFPVVDVDSPEPDPS